MRAGIGSIRHLVLAASLLAVGTVAVNIAPEAGAYAPEAVRSYNQGIEAYNQGHSTEALKKFQRVVQVDPTYADAYYNMGSIHYQLKQYEAARDMFRKAVSLNPADGQARYNLALTLEKMSRPEEALDILQQISTGDPKAAQARTKMEELRAAIAARNAAASTRPASPLVQPGPSAKPILQTFSRGYDGPTGIVIGPGGFMYVANYTKNLIYRVGANGDKTVFAQGDHIKGPIGLAFNPKTNELYVASYLLNSIARIDATGKSEVLVSGLNKPYNLFLDTMNNVLYVSEQDPANVISRITLPAGQ